MKKILTSKDRSLIFIIGCILFILICLVAAVLLKEKQASYNLTVEEVSVVIPGLQKDYKLAWVSDLHIIADVPLAEDCKDVTAEKYPTIQDRHDNIFVTADGVHSVELWPRIVDWLNDQELDGVILGGDLLDYFSEANMEAFTAEYQRIEAPILYIRADHDFGEWNSGGYWYESQAIAEHAKLDGNNWSNQHFAFEEFSVVGINASHKSVTNDNWSRIVTLMDQEKPVLLVSHVPYGSNTDSSLEQLCMEVRGKAYYWPSERYIPAEAQPELLSRIHTLGTNIRQILAGHLHAGWDGMVNEEVPQHIFGPAYAGNVGLIHVTGEE